LLDVCELNDYLASFPLLGKGHAHAQKKKHKQNYYTKKHIKNASANQRDEGKPKQMHTTTNI